MSRVVLLAFIMLAAGIGILWWAFGVNPVDPGEVDLIGAGCDPVTVRHQAGPPVTNHSQWWIDGEPVTATVTHGWPLTEGQVAVLEPGPTDPTQARFEDTGTPRTGEGPKIHGSTPLQCNG